MADLSAPAPSPRPRPTMAATVTSLAALALGLVVTGALLLLAAALSLCSLFGDQCSTSEQSSIGVAALAALAVFLGVPAAVARARRDARWLLAPLVEIAVVVLLAALSAVL